MADVGSSSSGQQWPRVGDPDWIPLQDTLDPVDLAQSKDYIQHWTSIVRRIRRENIGFKLNDPDLSYIVHGALHNVVNENTRVILVLDSAGHVYGTEDGTLAFRHFLVLIKPRRRYQDDERYRMAWITMRVQLPLHDNSRSLAIFIGEEYYVLRAILSGDWKEEHGIHFQRIKATRASDVPVNQAINQVIDHLDMSKRRLAVHLNRVLQSWIRSMHGLSSISHVRITRSASKYDDIL
jgi:hypothetical protein